MQPAAKVKLLVQKGFSYDRRQLARTCSDEGIYRYART